MSFKELILLLISVLSTVGGQFCFKTGALKLGEVNSKNVIEHILTIILVPDLIAGLVFYGLGGVAYILLLTRVDISVAAPAISITYIFSVLLGYLVFGETIPVSRLIGLALIMSGVTLVIGKTT